MGTPAFHPGRIHLARLQQTMLAPATERDLAHFSVSLDLDFTEATNGFTTVEGISIRATLRDPQAITPKQMADTLLDLIVHQIVRERAGIRPGTPTPAGLLATARAALGLPPAEATSGPPPAPAAGG